MNPRDHLSAQQLDLLLLGASKDEAAARAHLAACERCRNELQTLEGDAAQFRAHVLPRTADAVRERARRSSPLEALRDLWKVLVPVAGLATAALVFLVMRPASEPTLAIKGGPTLQVFARRGEQVFKVEPGAQLMKGDRIRFVVEPGGATQLLVASLDGAGHFSVYFPSAGTQSATVSEGRSELPGSIELDEVPGEERVMAFFGDRPFTADEARAAFKGEPLPAGIKAVTLSWQKVR